MIASPGTPAAPGDPAALGSRRGRRLVAGLLALALLLAVFAVWFQWRQTRRCLEFYGADQARRIQSSPRVELWSLAHGPQAVAEGRDACGAPERFDPRPWRRLDVSHARGLVHLRRGLVEDANFDWRAIDAECWDVALAFYDFATEASPGCVVLVAFAGGRQDAPEGGRGRLAVLGRPEVLALGRLERGLRTWVDATLGETAGESRAGTASAGPP